MKKTSMFQRVKIIVSVLFIITGVVLGVIPFIAPVITQQHQNEVISQYKTKISNMTTEEIQEAKDGAKEYNETGKSNFYTAMDTDTVISFIEIPSIDVYLPIFKGTATHTLERGIGQLEGTSFPIGGKGTHCVLSGHSGLVTQKMFTDLSKMEIGDKFYLNTYDEVLCYKVYKTIVVEPDEVSKLIKFDIDHDYCTLLTCTPIGINTHRLLVMGERVEGTENETEAYTEPSKTNPTAAYGNSDFDTQENKETNELTETKGLDSFFKTEYIFCFIISTILELVGIVVFVKTIREIHHI